MLGRDMCFLERFQEVDLVAEIVLHVGTKNRTLAGGLRRGSSGRMVCVCVASGVRPSLPFCAAYLRHCIHVYM